MKYQYNKYAIEYTDTAQWVQINIYWVRGGGGVDPPGFGSTNYTFDGATNKYTPSGTVKYIETARDYSGYLYQVEFDQSGGQQQIPSSVLYRKKVTQITNDYDYKWTAWKKDASSNTSTKGALVTTVVAEEGTYPDDGKHTDGYWYTKGLPVYEWKKYNVAWADTAPWIYDTTYSSGNYPGTGGYTQYSFIVETNIYGMTGGTYKYWNQQSPYIPVGEYIYDLGDASASIYRYLKNSDGTVTVHYKKKEQNSKNRGVFNADVTDPNELAYPDDGIHSDGYWYVKNAINRTPTIDNVSIEGITSPLNGGSTLIQVLDDLSVSFVPNDLDGSETLQYQILLNGIVKVAYTQVAKGTTVNYTIPKADLQIGHNLLEIKVKDIDNAIMNFNYTLSNRFPANYSLREVYETIMKFF